PHHPDTLTSRECLAVAYLAAGRTNAAIASLEATLKLREPKLGPDHPDSLKTRSKLAAAYWKAGRLDRSIPLFAATLKLQEAELGPDHPHALLTRANLGVNYRDAGRPEEGAQLIEDALRRAEGRSDALATLAWVPAELASAYSAAGQYSRAEPLLRDALERA